MQKSILNEFLIGKTRNFRNTIAEALSFILHSKTQFLRKKNPDWKTSNRDK